jgi:hypothetical protein
MADTIFPSPIVIFTQYYSISGGLHLREQRLSDYLNDRRDTSILLRNPGVARLEQPARVLETTVSAIIPKAGIVLAFELPQKGAPAPRQFMKYPKHKYDVFLALDGMEVRGKLNQPGTLDLRHAIANAAESFLPITQASVIIAANPGLVIQREAVLVNVQHIRFLGDLEVQAGEEKP